MSLGLATSGFLRLAFRPLFINSYEVFSGAGITASLLPTEGSCISPSPLDTLICRADCGEEDRRKAGRWAAIDLPCESRGMEKMAGHKHESTGGLKQHFHGLEIGAVSLKAAHRKETGETTAEVHRHGGNPAGKVLEVFERSADPMGTKIVVTGQAARLLLDLPYRSETECLEKALSFHGSKPDLLLCLGGETFSLYPMKDGSIWNVISTSKCAAGTGEFIVQQFQRMGLSLEEGLSEARKGRLVRLATRCSVHCKSDATYKLNKGECTPGDIARSLVSDLAKKVSELVELAQWPAGEIVICGGGLPKRAFRRLSPQIPPTVRGQGSAGERIPGSLRRQPLRL